VKIFNVHVICLRFNVSYDDGWYEFVFRWWWGRASITWHEHGSARWLAASMAVRANYGDSISKTDERSGHDISLQVEIDAGVAIEEVSCRSHVIAKDALHGAPQVSLSPNDRIPNKDFVLRYRVAGSRIKSNLLTTG